MRKRTPPEYVPAPDAGNRFVAFARHIVAVPKREIDKRLAAARKTKAKLPAHTKVLTS